MHAHTVEAIVSRTLRMGPPTVDSGYRIAPFGGRTAVAEPETGDAGAWSPPESGDTQREQARAAWNMALTASVLTMVSPCLSYVTLFAALPLALVALSRGRRILESGPDEVTEVYARTARTLGIASAAFSAFFLVMLVLVVLFYVGVGVFAVIAASSEGA